jgi:hypothetical protein
MLAGAERRGGGGAQVQKRVSRVQVTDVWATRAYFTRTFPAASPCIRMVHSNTFFPDLRRPYSRTVKLYASPRSRYTTFGSSPALVISSLKSCSGLRNTSAGYIFSDVWKEMVGARTVVVVVDRDRHIRLDEVDELDALLCVHRHHEERGVRAGDRRPTCASFIHTCSPPETEAAYRGGRA